MGYVEQLRLNNLNKSSSNPWFSGAITNNNFNSTFSQGQQSGGGDGAYNPYKANFNIGQSQNLYGNDYTTGQGFMASQEQQGQGGGNGQQAMRTAGAVLSASDDIGNTIMNVKGKLDKWKDMSFTQADTTINGMPNYSGVSELNKQVSGLSDEFRRDNNNIVGETALGGAKAGYEIGSSFTPIGGLIGGFIGGAVGFLGGGIASNKMREEGNKRVKEGREAFLSSQQDYNVNVGDYFQGIDQQRQETQEERNYANRIYGANQYNDPFQQLLG